jgi:hypothetical protein
MDVAADCQRLTRSCGLYGYTQSTHGGLFGTGRLLPNAIPDIIRQECTFKFGIYFQ